MSNHGPKTNLTELLGEHFAEDDQQLRADLLIDFASRFQSVPEHVAVHPYPESNLVPGCQSEAYVWAEPLPDGTLKFYFAVENPQGISAKAMAVILDETLSGLPLEEILKVQSEIVYQIFGRGIGMGKGQGLMGMLFMVQALTRQKLAAPNAAL